MRTVLATNSVVPANTSAAWRDAVCDTFVRLECELEKRAAFHGLLEAGAVGDLHVARVKSSPQVVRRTRELADQASDAFVLLSIQTRGKTLIQQGNHEAMLTPGCIAFYDTARPYTLSLPNDFDQIVLHLPRDLLEKSAPGGLDHMAKKLNGSNPFAQAILALAPQLLRIATAAPTMLAQRTAAAAIELISLALASLGSGKDAALSTERDTTVLTTASADSILWRARDVISQNIEDSHLNPSALAAQVKVSLRRLQEVFKAQGTTPSDCIWEMRLEYARSLLATHQHQKDSITTLAYRAGFSDIAHFSRRFRQEFGITPKEYRQSAILV
jgi:AraC-like DNA-binding protein